MQSSPRPDEIKLDRSADVASSVQEGNSTLVPTSCLRSGRRHRVWFQALPRWGLDGAVATPRRVGKVSLQTLVVGLRETSLQSIFVGDEGSANINYITSKEQSKDSKIRNCFVCRYWSTRYFARLLFVWFLFSALRGKRWRALNAPRNFPKWPASQTVSAEEVPPAAISRRCAHKSRRAKVNVRCSTAGLLAFLSLSGGYG